MKKALFGIMACLVLFGLVLTGCEDLMGAVGGLTGKKVTGVSLPATLEISVGHSEPLTATFTPADADDKTAKWTSSNSKIATVNEDGIVTGVAGGAAIITVTTVEGGHKAHCTVTVTAAVTRVTLSPPTLTIGVNREGKLTATIEPAEATNKAVTWDSDAKDVATVIGGVVTGIKAGTATITVTTVDGDFKAACTVTVTQNTTDGDEIGTTTPDAEIPVTGVTLDKTTLGIAVDETGVLAPVFDPPNATNKAVTWTSSNDIVATVIGGVVIGKKAGTATITVTTDDGGKTATSVVTVKAAVSDPGKEEPGKEEPGQPLATVTITGIPSHYNGLARLGLYPAGTAIEDLAQLPDPVAEGEGKISNGIVTIAIYSTSDRNPQNGSYIAGLLIIDDTTPFPSYAGYTTVNNQTTSIAFSAFKDVTDKISQEEPGQSLGSVTITGIPSHYNGLARLGLYPAGTAIEDLAQLPDPVAGGDGRISNGVATIAIHSFSDRNPQNGSYIAGLLIIDDTTQFPSYAGYATVNNQTTSIAFSAFKDVTDKISQEEPGKEEPGPVPTQATVTVTNIRTNLWGNGVALAIYPAGTDLENNSASAVPLALGFGGISSGTATVALFVNSSSEYGESIPWVPEYGRYVAGFGVIGGGDTPIYAGYTTTLSFSNQTATIDFGAFTDVTDKISQEEPGTEEPGPTQTSVTITNIPSDFSNKMVSLAIFAKEINFEDPGDSWIEPIALGLGQLSSGTAIVPLFDASFESPYYLSDGRYGAVFSVTNGINDDSPIYVGYASLWFSNQTATIEFWTFNDITDKISQEEPEPVPPQTSVTVTGIPSRYNGLASLGLYPAGTDLENNSASAVPLALGFGEISYGTASVYLFVNTSSEYGESIPWLPGYDSYVAGFGVIGGGNTPIYAGYATLSFSNQTATIDFWTFNDITAKISQEEPGKEEPGPYEPGDGELAGATNWDEAQWSKWFDNHAFSDYYMAVSDFARLNSNWIQNNFWWSSLYAAWTSGAGPYEPGPYEPGDGDLAGATSWDEAQWSKWFNNHAFSDYYMALLDFIEANSWWIESNNYWWSSLYTVWMGSSAGPFEPRPDNGELADATNWDEAQWSKWFDGHASDPNNLMLIGVFTSDNYMWVASNSWWHSLYTAWAGIGVY